MSGMRYQPQGRVVVSSRWRNLGLESLTLFQSTEVEAAAPSGLFRIGTGHAVKVSSIGIGASQNSGSNYWRTNLLGRTIGTGNQFAVMVAFQLNATGQASKYLVMDGSGTTQSAIILGYVANTIEFFAQGYSGSDPRPGSQIVVNDTNPHVLIYSYDGVNFRGFLDGVEKFSIARNFSLATSTSIGFIGASTAAAASLANVTIYAHSRFNKGLFPETGRRLSENPWQIFEEPEEDFSETAAISSVSVTGQWEEQSEATQAQLAASVRANNAWAEGSEASNLVARSDVLASAAWVEASDSTQISGRFDVLASAAWTESGESSLVQATIGSVVTASASWSEATESMAVSLAARVNAGVGWVEQAENFTLASQVGAAVSGAISWSEGSEVNSIQSAAKANLAAAWSEGSDVFVVRMQNGEQSPSMDASLVPFRRTIVFEGGRRVVTF